MAYFFITSLAVPIVSLISSLVCAFKGDFIISRMRHVNSKGTLAYNLYRDSAMTQVWADGSGGSKVILGNRHRDATGVSRIPIW